MKLTKGLRSIAMIGTLLCSMGGVAVAAPVDGIGSLSAHDGQHDFDFNIGVWRTHILRTLDPFKAGSETIELNGIVTIRKVWDGRASLEEIEADGPKGHWEALSLFLYNPQAHQWSRSFVNARDPVVSGAFVGSFKDGRGELFQQDTVDGRGILVRGVFSDIRPDTHTYIESYSDDGGTTWHTALVAHLTRDHA